MRFLLRHRSVTQGITIDIPQGMTIRIPQIHSRLHGWRSAIAKDVQTKHRVSNDLLPKKEVGEPNADKLENSACHDSESDSRETQPCVELSKNLTKEMPVSSNDSQSPEAESRRTGDCDDFAQGDTGKSKHSQDSNYDSDNISTEKQAEPLVCLV